MERPYTLPRIASLDKPLRLAVLISGGGSGLEALLNHQEIPRLHATKLIISDNSNAKGLDYGVKKNINTKAIPLPEIPDKIEQRILHESLVHAELIKSEIELIVLMISLRCLHY